MNDAHENQQPLAPQGEAPARLQKKWSVALDIFLDCVLFNKEMAAQLLAALHKQDLPQLAAEIGPDWDLPADAVQRGLKTLCSHLEKVQDSTVLLYEMI